MSDMSSKAGQPADTATESVKFQPERTHILAAVVIFLIFLLGVGYAPLYLFWILAFPIVFIFWVLKSETRVGENGVEIDYAFRGNRRFGWDEVEGVAFKGSKALLRTTSQSNHSLPGVTFNSLPLLQEASTGRIPDVLTAGRAAADDKVVVFNKDGEQILITREEHAEREAAKARREAETSAEQTERDKTMDDNSTEVAPEHTSSVPDDGDTPDNPRD
ncbi:PH domain-containing protein [Corynebacterium sp. A21]|uniref:PH domain-containing protein n=1 Tax=Corynebacterium sp. A21 TaxID=3457318 RepID=UPI003FD38752